MKGRGIRITGAMVVALMLWAALQFLLGISALIFWPDEFNLEKTSLYFFVTVGLALLFFLLNRAKKWLDQP
jgi:hypothetical protein